MEKIVSKHKRETRQHKRNIYKLKKRLKILQPIDDSDQ